MERGSASFSLYVYNLKYYTIGIYMLSILCVFPTMYFSAQVMRILDFLEVSYLPQEVEQRLLKDVTTFQRSKQDVNIDPYTSEQRKLIREVLQQIIAKLQQENNGDTLGIEEYLDSD